MMFSAREVAGGTQGPVGLGSCCMCVVLYGSGWCRYRCVTQMGVKLINGKFAVTKVNNNDARQRLMLIWPEQDAIRCRPGKWEMLGKLHDVDWKVLTEWKGVSLE